MGNLRGIFILKGVFYLYNPYRVLGVSSLDSLDKIKSVYRKLCKQYHPDEEGGDVVKFAEISKAWKVISESHAKGESERSVYSFKTLFNIVKVRRAL